MEYAYEAIVYVAYDYVFFGLAFDIKLTVARCICIGYFICSLHELIDPEIANLQPVLNSYWLMIHVAVIVASYGPLV
jgi:ABC-type transport system involved in cytochrome c biogenesis permease subunit